MEITQNKNMTLMLIGGVALLVILRVGFVNLPDVFLHAASRVGDTTHGHVGEVSR